VQVKRYLIMLLTLAAFGSTTAAMASDLQCATTQQPAERVICDHAILNNEYDDIFAQQQALLNAGRLSAQQVAQWRQARNACTDVHCVDVVFAQWTAMTRGVQPGAQAAQTPAMASSTDMAPVGPAPDAVPALPTPSPAVAVADAASGASLVHQGSAAGVALPEPVAPQASGTSPASAMAPAPSAPLDTRSGSGLGIGLIVALLIVAGLGVVFVLRKTQSGRR
jgi:uncharacterized protein